LTQIRFHPDARRLIVFAHYGEFFLASVAATLPPPSLNPISACYVSHHIMAVLHSCLHKGSHPSFQQTRSKQTKKQTKNNSHDRKTESPQFKPKTKKQLKQKHSVSTTTTITQAPTTSLLLGQCCDAVSPSMIILSTQRGVS
jgi:hypothetical protein